MAHSVAVGWDHPAYKRLGAIFVVRKHEVEYLAPCFAGEKLRASTWVDRFELASSVRATTITRVTDDKLLCRASTLWVFVPYDGGRPRRIPPEVRDAFSEFCQ
jgi:acyl-CoA thioester hydrolase